MLNEKNRIVRCAKIRERNQSICWYFSDKEKYKTWNVKQEDGLHYEVETEDNTISFPYNYDYSGSGMDIACYIE